MRALLEQQPVFDSPPSGDPVTPEEQIDILQQRPRRIAGSIRASLSHSVAASRSKALRRQGPGPGVSHVKLLSFHAPLAEAAVE